jgi:RND family efflux transporter MFP subunit
MKTLLKYIAIALVVGFGVITFYKKVYIPKTTYETLSASRGDLSVEVFGIGNVDAEHIYSITSQTGGKILNLYTDEGKWVKKGDVLVKIDSIDIPQQLKEAQIAVQKASSEANATKKELKSLYAQQQLAQITYKRYAKLKQQSFASKAEYDKAKADLDVINAQIQASKAHLQSALMEIERSKEAVNALKERLSRYEISSPIDGFVISRKAEVAQSVLPSQVIFEIVDPNSVWVKTYIDEKLAGRVKLNQKATIQLRSQFEKKFSGKVVKIVPVSDKITKEREVDVKFDKLPMPFFINEQAQVSIASKTYKNIIKVPARALSFYDGKSGVWVAKDNKAHFSPLKIIARGNKFVAVSGIDEKAVILVETDKNKPLKEGASIHL